MKKKDDLDELLYKYMPIVDEELISELEMQVDGEFVFSEEFEKKMSKVIRWNKFYSRLERLKKSTKYIAASLILALGLCMTFSQTARAYSGMLFERIKTIWEDSFIYTYFVEDSVCEEEVEMREPSYIPKDYSCMNSVSNEIMWYAIYEDAQGNQITYQQMLVTNEEKTVMDLEYISEKTIDLNGNVLTLYFYEDGYIHAYYTWDKYIWEITADDIQEEEIYKIIEDVVKNYEK